ncbi:MAG TPA: hypothetical protein PLV92_19890, partial [Pirellulaceae bacterium]|nr:hypothetical protein [Pirellulaceae bacterium]
GVEQVKVRLHDRLLDLDQPLEIKVGEQVAFDGRVARTIASQAASLAERADPRSVWRGEVVVSAATAAAK